MLAETEDRVREGSSGVARVWPMGFSPLDTYLGGGLRAGELTVLGGPQGLGKTTFALQVARNIAAAGGSVLFLTFEHDSATMFERLVALEAGEYAHDEGITLRNVREALASTDETPGGLSARLGTDRGGAAAVAAIAEYGDRLFVVSAQTRDTSTDSIRELVLGLAKEEPPVVVVDYLQKIPDGNGHDAESERITRVVQALKDLALEAAVPVLAISASEREGIAPGARMRSHHLRGTSAVAYEADVILVMSDKYDVVAREHIVFGSKNAERYHDWVVFTIEKNRSGLARVDVEFRKRLEQGRLDPQGQSVAERLVDERVQGA